jgi:hypothetical protein
MYGFAHHKEAATLGLAWPVVAATRDGGAEARGGRRRGFGGVLVHEVVVISVEVDRLHIVVPAELLAHCQRPC